MSDGKLNYTKIVFSGGNSVVIEKPYSEFRDLIEKSIRSGSSKFFDGFLEISGGTPNGTITIQLNNVCYIMPTENKVSIW